MAKIGIASAKRSISNPQQILALANVPLESQALGEIKQALEFKLQNLSSVSLSNTDLFTKSFTRDKRPATTWSAC